MFQFVFLFYAFILKQDWVFWDCVSFVLSACVFGGGICESVYLRGFVLSVQVWVNSVVFS